MTLDDFVRDASLFQSVLDVGCGTGRWTKKIMSPYVIGIDAHMPTLEVAARACPNAILVCGDMRKLTEIFPENCVECIVAMDSIEHLERAEALDVLKQFEEIALVRVMLFVPTGNHPQTGDATNLGNAHFQTHRSTWYPNDFRELGYTVTELPNFHGASGKDSGAVTAVKTMGS